MFKHELFLGSLTTQLTIPLPQHRPQTFEELLSSDNNFTVGFYLQSLVKEFPEYQKAHNSGRVTVKEIHFVQPSKSVYFTQCSYIENFMKITKSENFYIFPKKLKSHLTFHEMGYTNPYTETFQDLVTRAYSSGLHRAWETFVDLEAFNVTRKQEKEEKSSLLTFYDMQRIFFVFPVGMAVALFIFLLEIFYYDFYARFSWQEYMRKFAWKENKKIKVRKIQVRPINETQM